MDGSLNRVSAFFGTLISVLFIAVTAVSLLVIRSQINSTTVALIFIAGIVLLATFFEWIAAMIASVVAAFVFNFFFLEPYHTLTIDDPQNWVAFFVFLAVALSVGHLSATSNRRRVIAEGLYTKIEVAFEKASAAEALRRSEQLKSALLDAVTHDFRTPLTSIKASATMLIEDNEFATRESRLDGHGRRELLKVINEETDRLNSFVESMVEVARFQAGSGELQLRSVKPDEIIVKAAKRSKEIQRTHKFRSSLAPDLPAVRVDTRSIVEALHNLIDNASKYAPSGTTIFLSAFEADRRVRFAVEDEGPGIAEAERDSIFQRFYRNEKEEKPGLGMGLAIVRGIIEAHGGEIWAESGAKGAKIVFQLPIDENG